MNKHYSVKIAQLEQEADQAKTELSEAQKQLQELEEKESKDQVQKAKLQKDFRKKMEAAKIKMQVGVSICNTNPFSQAIVFIFFQHSLLNIVMLMFYF